MKRGFTVLVFLFILISLSFVSGETVRCGGCDINVGSCTSSKTSNEECSGGVSHIFIDYEIKWVWNKSNINSNTKVDDFWFWSVEDNVYYRDYGNLSGQCNEKSGKLFLECPDKVKLNFFDWIK